MKKFYLFAQKYAALLSAIPLCDIQGTLENPVKKIKKLSNFNSFSILIGGDNPLMNTASLIVLYLMIIIIEMV